MAKTIWKFPLKTTDEQVIIMPAGAEILTIQTQYEEPCIWALVDPLRPKKERIILIHGTGHPVSDTIKKQTYIGTYQLHGGSLVFHAFEAIE